MAPAAVVLPVVAVALAAAEGAAAPEALALPPLGARA
jgi:hypothetical protein